MGNIGVTSEHRSVCSLSPRVHLLAHTAGIATHLYATTVIGERVCPAGQRDEEQ